MERRKVPDEAKVQAKPTTLPLDYLKMVTEIFTATFDGGLKALEALGFKAGFKAAGDLYADEVVVGVSLVFEGQMAATTVYASSDFDPQASSPTLEELLSTCVDAVGGVFQILLDPKEQARIESLTAGSLGAMEDVPYRWTPMEIGRRSLHIRVDKANPVLDQATDEWLAKNDPNYGRGEATEDEDAQELAEERIDAMLEEKAGIRRRTH